ncbi:hypothetical protein GCM10022221_16430 [Actinocorallia aurea]
MADFLIPLVLVFVIPVLWSMDARLRRVERTLQRLTRRLDLLIVHQGAEAPAPDGMAEVDLLLAQGKKIQAIKRYRELTGAPLADAKKAVEHRETTR